jgi:hypothetical protein
MYHFEAERGGQGRGGLSREALTRRPIDLLGKPEDATK